MEPNNSELIEDDDDLNQYINDMNRPSANNSRRSRSGRASGASQANPGSGNNGGGSSIMNIAQGVVHPMNNSKNFIPGKNFSWDSVGTSDEATNTEQQIRLITRAMSQHF